MGIQSRFCTISYELRSSFLAIRESFGSRWKADIVGMRTAKEARERRRARAAERRALDALAARIRSTALDGYEASHGDGGDTSDARRVDAHRNENEDARTEPPTTSALRDVQRERDALLLRVEHLERAAARDAATAVAGVAERAAEGTRVAFVDRLADAASALAEAREETRARARARVADLERTAPARAAALEEATRARVAEAVAEERARGDARLRAAADAVAEAHHAKVAADARARARRRRGGAPRGAPGHAGLVAGSAREGRGARAAERSHIVGGRDRACERAGGVRGRAASAGARRRRVDARRRRGGAEVGTRFFSTIPVPVRSKRTAKTTTRASPSGGSRRGSARRAIRLAATTCPVASRRRRRRRANRFWPGMTNDVSFVGVARARASRARARYRIGAHSLRIERLRIVRVAKTLVELWLPRGTLRVRRAWWSDISRSRGRTRS